MHVNVNCFRLGRGMGRGGATAEGCRQQQEEVLLCLPKSCGMWKILYSIFMCIRVNTAGQIACFIYLAVFVEHTAGTSGQISLCQPDVKLSD